MHRFACLVCLFLLAAWTVGCSPKNDPAPSTAAVKGTVSLDGKPMTSGEVRFSVPGQPPKSVEIKGGTFEGVVFVGRNQVDVVLEKDGPPSSTDPNTPTKINAVAPPKTPLNTEVGKAGASDLKFEVTSIPGR